MAARARRYSLDPRKSPGGSRPFPRPGPRAPASPRPRSAPSGAHRPAVRRATAATIGRSARVRSGARNAVMPPVSILTAVMIRAPAAGCRPARREFHGQHAIVTGQPHRGVVDEQGRPEARSTARPWPRSRRWSPVARSVLGSLAPGCLPDSRRDAGIVRQTLKSRGGTDQQPILAVPLNRVEVKALKVHDQDGLECVGRVHHRPSAHHDRAGAAQARKRVVEGGRA